jgi:hypothetical protein
MRKNTSFAIVAAIMGLAIVSWAKTSVVATSATARPQIGTPSYVATSAPYLPFQVLEPSY